MKDIYNGKLMDTMEIVKLKSKERKGFSAGIISVMGYDKGEYNRMIGEIKNSIPNLHPLCDAMFPFAN